MSLVRARAIVLSAIRYSETSKIVRLATRDMGVQSAIAKGALRPKSRFGAALQLMSEGDAELLVKEHRELHILAGFELVRLHTGLAQDLDRYAPAATLAETMLRLAPAAPHPESFDLLSGALERLDTAAAADLPALGCRLVWQLVSVLGFAPSLDVCARDGAPLPPDGPLPFSARDGGALCNACALVHSSVTLPADARRDLDALLDPEAPLPALDDRHAAAHRRLLGRYMRHHLTEGTALPALDFWVARSWDR